MFKGPRFRINAPRVTHQTIDGEVIIVDLETGNYYSLEATGAKIWEWIEQFGSVEHIVQACSRAYAGQRSLIESQVRKLITELEHEGLIAQDSVQELAQDSGSEPAGTRETPGLKAAPKAGDPTPFASPFLNKYTDMREFLLADPVHEVNVHGWPHLKSDSTDR